MEYFAEDAVSEAISTANTSIVIQGLLPFTTYIVQVQASTEVGCGPFSQQSALTLEEGAYNIGCYYRYMAYGSYVSLVKGEGASLISETSVACYWLATLCFTAPEGIN